MTTSLFDQLMHSQPISLIATDTPDRFISAVEGCMRTQGVAPVIVRAGLLESCDFAPVRVTLKNTVTMHQEPRTPTRHQDKHGLILRDLHLLTEDATPGLIDDLLRRRRGWVAALSAGAKPAVLTSWHTTVTLADAHTDILYDIIGRDPRATQLLSSFS